MEKPPCDPAGAWPREPARGPHPCTPAWAARLDMPDRPPLHPSTARTRAPCPHLRPRRECVLLVNAGRSSDSQARPAARLLATPGQSPARSQWLEHSRPRSPGHSGGAVPESHRSSLFARHPQPRTRGHQIRRRSLTVVRGLSSCEASAATTGTVSHAACGGVKDCRLRRNAGGSCAGCTAARRTVVARRTHRISCPQHATSPRAENTCCRSRAFPPPADSPSCPPGQSLCPSGNQGAAATCQCFESRNGSTGLPQDGSWIMTSG
jgi:hypothetical protein